MRRDDATFETLRCWRTSAPRGKVIYDEGDESGAFYRLEAGCVRLQVNHDDGHRQILAFCMPGDIFGLQTSGRREHAAEAAAPSLLTRFPSSVLTGGDLDPCLAAGLIGAAVQMSTALTDHLKGLSHSHADERLLWFLEWLAERQPTGAPSTLLELPMSRRDVADFLGLAQETLSRTFARLEEQGRIRILSSRRLVLGGRPGPRAHEFRGAA